ncbi:insulin-induced protein-domain-containing protein [Triangularia verruculosa]|uniref:Insulin-induced protein-domain-containing protein n=1 Tax=Triangularia verruculosa TaxID=2587418 RepID=A0AAN6XH67_9PEZI|nr:insulin-induced protein-domain-containing protein [Triangularia verruculosa]
MEESPERQSPEILRPIPRRPFRLAFTSPTPPEEDSAPPSATQTPGITASDLAFLNIHNNPSQPTKTTSSISRATSLLNLTGSTLLGIYSPSLTPGIKPDTADTPSWDNNNDNQTPGIPQSPDPGDIDEQTLKLIKKRRDSSSRINNSHIRTSIRTSYFPSLTPTADSLKAPEPPSQTQIIISTVLRGTLLFALGLGYGILVTRLPRAQQNSNDPSSTPPPDEPLDWRYLIFWGASGVLLGCLLPWFDQFFIPTNKNGKLSPKPLPTSPQQQREKEREERQQEADYVLVIRSIGVFVGIVFAIRKLSWTSTMQVSLTLALINPFIWYLIDRSKPGFLLSAFVGLMGTVGMIGLGLQEVFPGLMPAPSFYHHAGGGGGVLGGSGRSGQNGSASAGYVTGMGTVKLGGEREVIETGVWMLSVLFCSCVCFGNIGRRLALSGEGATRGRWGGVR